MLAWLPPVFLGATLLVATICDVRTQQVPLWLTLGSIVAGLALASVRGMPALAASGLGLAAGLGISVPFVFLGGLGAADALLLGAVGTWGGWHLALWTAWWTSLVGAVVAVVLWRRWRKRRFPYLPAILAGAVLGTMAMWK